MYGRASNWAGNVVYGAARLHRPVTLDELRRIVAGSRRARALGTRHSFNHLADTPGDLIDVTALPFTVDVDTDNLRAKVSAGARYGELATYLQRHGLALHNLGSLPHISVAGACATATHGSGDGNRNLAGQVCGLELMTADGDVLEVERDSDGFAGTVVGLGALGVVTSLTLDLEPTYQIRQYVYEDLPGTSLGDDDLDAILAGAYSVSLFTDWHGDGINQVWLKHRVGHPHPAPGPEWMGARRAEGQRHPIRGANPASCTEQDGVPGPWHQRLPHFRLESVPSAGAELQSEYLVPRRRAADALAAVAGIRDRVAPVLLVSEIRSVAADEFWMSPSYRRDSVGVHFTWVPDPAAVLPVLAVLEEVLAPFDARPHWGKLFTPGAVVGGRYERAPDFVDLMHRYDPRGVFRNDLLDRCLST